MKNYDFRNYFLGLLSAEEAETLELNVVSDNESEGELLQAENNLIEDYLDKNLTTEELKCFNKNFLITEERRERVEFNRLMRSFSPQPIPRPAMENENKTTFRERLKSFLKPRKFAFGFVSLALILTIVLVVYLSWNKSSSNPEISVLLNKSFKNDRPTEARITDFDYAPKIEGTRGNDDKTQNLNFVSAQSRALEAVLKNETAESLHELGRVYLAGRNFDEAIKLFEKATGKNSNLAKLHNDLGVALMEKGRLIKVRCQEKAQLKLECDDEKTSSLELFARANEEFVKSIQLDRHLAEAFFNHALCLQLIPSPQGAKEAWEEYLRLDASSQWSKEARKNLESIESKKSQNYSADELEKEFSRLFRQKKDEEAWQLISQTRELIKEKYLPQRLAVSFLNSAKEERAEKLAELQYLGELEKERMNDSFAADLAEYYAGVSEEKIELLKNAQAAVKKGYQFCLNESFTEAKKQFSLAEKYFSEAGDFIEARTICRHFIAYCFYNLDKKNDALKLFNKVDKFCERQNYKWFYVLNLHWRIGWGYESPLKESTAKIKADHENGLRLAEEINDSYMTQKFLLSSASRSFFVKQKKETLKYLQKLFEISIQPNISIRQKFRNYTTSIEILASMNLQNLAESFLNDAIKLAAETEDLSFIVHSEVNAGIIYTLLNDRETARKWFQNARQSAENIIEEAERKDLLARILLNEGNLEKKIHNYREAAPLYEKAAAILETMETPVMLYEAQKSKLLVYQALKNSDEVEKQIPVVLELAENNRRKISAEQERNSFFDNEQTIYDIAAEHNFQLGRNETAFNYSELANSRSLLDWIKRGASVSGDKKRLEVLFDESEKPLPLDEIRAKMPAEVQIVQYSVLENEVLIWLVSKEKFVVESVQISSGDLKVKIENYLDAIQNNDLESQTAGGRELYKYLLSPILPHLDATKEICLIPNKVLFKVPFAALVSPGGSYFLSEFSVFYAPSANVFLAATKESSQKTDRENESLLSVGNPKFNHREFALENLPNAESEAEEIARYYPNSKLLLGEKADKQAFRAAYKNADIIHFAGHYLVREGTPLLSGLVLAQDKKGGSEESLLTNSELIGGKLSKTKLVVLSACQTGVEGYYNGEGLIGLSRTFLSSGVPLVIASQWKVDSEATAVLMKNFHRYRKLEKFTTQRALRQAQLDMLKEQGRFSSPYYWASFALFGGYAKF